MTKVVSLSNSAYRTLKRLERPNESFSDLVLRMAGERKKRSLLEFAGAWKGKDIDAVFLQVMKDREGTSSRRVEV